MKKLIVKQCLQKGILNPLFHKHTNALNHNAMKLDFKSVEFVVASLLFTSIDFIAHPTCGNIPFTPIIMAHDDFDQSDFS